MDNIGRMGYLIEYPPVSSNMASLKIHHTWRFLAGKIIELNGAFSSELQYMFFCFSGLNC